MRWRGVLFGVVILVVLSMSAGSAAEIDEAFSRTWERVDRTVAEGRVDRTWTWGPQANTGAFSEPYADAPGGERLVQYFDKSRMEINDPAADPEAEWYVTNGLLALELITGEMQTGDDSFENRAPAEVHIAGDAHPDTPTYASLNQVLDREPVPVGAPVTETIDQAGTVTTDPAMADHGVTGAYFIPETGHTIASIFWDFMNAEGEVYFDGEYVTAALFPSPFFVVGFPVTEAYWVHVPVAGDPRDVLVQCFERRCLTYTPENPEGWQVEAGNVGQHYHAWRYGDPGGDPGERDPLSPPDEDALGPPVPGACAASPQARLTEVADSLGNVNPNSWVKGTGGDWPGGVDASPVVSVGQEVTLTASATGECEPLEFRFQRYRDGRATGVIRDWSSEPRVTYTFTGDDAGERFFFIVDVRDQDPRAHFDDRDDYAYLTYRVEQGDSRNNDADG